MMIPVTFLKSCKSGGMVYFKFVLNSGSGARNHFIPREYNKAPDEGAQVLPRCIEKIKKLFTALV